MSGALDEEAAQIAVIGMACRFPGARDPEEFWANLAAGVDSVTRFPPRPVPGGQGSYIPAGAFVTGPEWFDAGYFGYSPREAQIIDPQQRVFLECAAEALEDAGCDPERHRGPIGVYAGSGDTSYAATLRARQATLPSVTDWEIRLATGADFLTSRVAYKLGLRGPTITVRAACATSLVAVHLAAQGLLAGDCDLALAGGVTIRLPAEPGLYAEGGVVSPDGRCRSFDAGARGLVGGQGACVVALKRLPEALADGYPVRAIMRGSAVNNDGPDRIGYTAPSVDGQAAVIRTAQLVAGVEPRTITYVEAHGSATPIGDPIELTALTRAFQAGPQYGPGQRGYCGIGSVKTNIGHTDAAAGGAGFIKTVLALERGFLPPSLHFTEPNPQIDFEASPFRVVTRLRRWQPEGMPRRAGVSSFGIGGTNAHVVLEQPPPPGPAGPSGPWQLLVLSARTPAALDAMTGRLAAHLRAHPELSLPDVAWTLQVGRREHSHRRYAVVRGREDALRVLDGQDRHRLVSSAAPAPGHTVSGDAGDAGDPASEAGLATAGERWLAGKPVCWADLHPGEHRRRVPLPAYPFERRRHIVEPEVPAALPQAPQEPAPERPAGEASVQQTVAGLFAEMLGLDEIDPDDSFFDLGGDSLVATQLLVRIRKIFPAQLTLRSVFEAPTAAAFAALISGRMSPPGGGPRRTPWLVCREPRPEAAGDLYCFPHAGGVPGEFARWSDGLPGLRVWGVQPPGRGARLLEPPCTRMTALVDAVVDSVPFEGRYLLFGHSLGALVAFEVTRALRRLGRSQPGCLLVSACPPPAASASFAGAPAHCLPDQDLLAEIERRWGPLPGEIRQDADVLAATLACYRADLELLATYAYQPGEPLDCPVAVLGGTADPVSGALPGWREVTSGPYDLHTFPGGHFYFREQRHDVLRLVHHMTAREWAG